MTNTARKECKACRGTGDHCHLSECTDPCDECKGRGYHVYILDADDEPVRSLTDDEHEVIEEIEDALTEAISRSQEPPAMEHMEKYVAELNALPLDERQQLIAMLWTGDIDPPTDGIGDVKFEATGPLSMTASVRMVEPIKTITIIIKPMNDAANS